jgi:hypothetical protein
LGNKTPLTLDPENRLPVARYQYVNVTFEEANRDYEIKHRLAPVNAEDVRYKICRLSSGASIYQDLTPDRKPWQRGHIFLRSSVPTAARILLFLEAETEQVPMEAPLVPPRSRPPHWAFGIVTSPGEDEARADNSYDTLTLIEGEGIEITVDAENDSVTITNTCCGDDTGQEAVDCGGEIMWTSDPQLVAPAAATGVSVAPGSSGWGNGSWVEIEDSTSAGWVLTGVAFTPGSGFTSFEIDIGRGSSGNEQVVGTVRGRLASENVSVSYLPFPIPIDNIPEGSRVVARMRVGSGDATAWQIAVTYYAKPITGTVTATLNRSRIEPAAAEGLAITSGNPSFTKGSWVVVANPTPLEWALGAVTFDTTWGNETWELDFGVGESGSEEVICTVRSAAKDNTGVFRGGYFTTQIRPLRTVPAGSRLVARIACQTNGAIFNRMALTYYSQPETPAYVTDQRQRSAPPNAGNIQITCGTADVFGSWVTLLDQDATITDRAITGINLRHDTTGFNGRLSFGYGPVGNETEFAQITMPISNALTGANNDVAPILASYVPNNQRIAVRGISSNAGHTLGIAMSYINDPDFAQKTSTVAEVQDFSLGTTAGAWANSSWATVMTVAPTAYVITGIAWQSTPVSNGQFEVDLGVGEAGQEEVVTTFRTGIESPSTVNVLQLPIPLKLSTATRLAARVRASAAVGASHSFRLQYFEFDPPLYVCTGETGGEEGTEQSLPAFGVIAVSGQSSVEAEQDGDTLTLAAGTGITITTNATTDTVTITNSVTASNSFETISVDGEDDVVASSATDTLTLVAGDNIEITTDAATDTITITSTGGGGGGAGDPRWEPLTNGDPDAPELIFNSEGDVIMVFVEGEG